MCKNIIAIQLYAACLWGPSIQRFNELQALFSGGGFRKPKLFSTSERTRETEGRGCVVGWKTVGMKYISCGSTLTGSTCAVSHPKSSVLMESCLETHCFCHHTSQLGFPNTIQTFPLMSSPGKIQLELPADLRELLSNAESPDFHLQLKEGMHEWATDLPTSRCCAVYLVQVRQAASEAGPHLQT